MENYLTKYYEKLYESMKTMSNNAKRIQSEESTLKVHLDLNKNEK